MAAPCAVSEGVESVDSPASLPPLGQMNQGNTMNEMVIKTAHVATQRRLKKNKNKNKNNSDENDEGNNNENQQQEAEGAEEGGEGNGSEASDEGNEYYMEQDAQNYSDEEIENNYSGENEQEGNENEQEGNDYSYSGENAQEGNENEQEGNDNSSSDYDEQVSEEEIAYNYASGSDKQNGNDNTSSPFRFMEIYETAPAEWNSSQWALFTLFGSLLMMLSFLARDLVSKDDDEREQALYPKEIYPQPQPPQYQQYQPQSRSKRHRLRNLFMRRSPSRLLSSQSSIESHSSGFSHSETGAFTRWQSEDCEDVNNYRRTDN